MRIVQLLRCVSVVETPWHWRLNGRQDSGINRREELSEVIGVVGAGTMGNGIAQVAARGGYDVILNDVRDEFIQRGLAAIDKSLQRDVDKERLSAEEKQRIVGRIRS